MKSPTGNAGTGSSPGPDRPRLRAELIRDSTDALMVQMYYADIRVWAGYGERST